jgi:aryl-alcohol dehydrogenase-like predicted oxidoreductase
MRYRPLGPTGLRPSIIGLGTWQFGGEWGVKFSQAAVDTILDAAADCGINLIDTAECYGPGHLSERLIGDYLSRHDRSRWIIATKFGHQFNHFLNRTDDFSVDGVRAQGKRRGHHRGEQAQGGVHGGNLTPVWITCQMDAPVGFYRSIQPPPTTTSS